MADADRWEQLHADQLGVERTVPHLEAEVRRLRAALLGVQHVLTDGLESKSWEKLLAAAWRAWKTAQEALRRPPRG